jgi:hypothetical protein
VGLERLEERTVFSNLPFGAMPDDTAEFMLGDVYVTVVLMESSNQTSATNNNSETWTPAAITSAKQRVVEGLQWWEDLLAIQTDRHHLDFHLDFTHADSPVVTSYEPITRSSTDFQFWIYDFLNQVGYNTRGNYHADIRAFNNAQRLAHDADWAYTIFVVNDQNDPDHQFAPGGFSRAFAFAGGEFLVSPASRPASTFAHETGHIFWAYDEYQPDGDFDRSRGYYNTQNLNSWDNPTPGFQQQPSIMTKDQLLTTAYQNHISPDSTLAMIGWQDSDGDGVFDVLDVPLTLTGSGYYDQISGEYRFGGSSHVQTLMNRNSSGLRNDITLNEVSRAQYRIDGGAWQTAVTYGGPSAELDLRIPISPAVSIIEIRTIDDVTGISSPIFRGFPARPSSVSMPGINGVIWRDADLDGALDPGERGISNVTVRLVDANGSPLVLGTAVEPDDFSSTSRLNSVRSGVTLSAVGNGVADDTVASLTAPNVSTGDQLFASFSSSCGGYCTEWTTDSRQMRMDFAAPVSTLSLDAIGSTLAGIGRLEVYGLDNQLLARYTTQQLATGEIETMTVSRPAADIKFAIARSHNNSVVRFDNLQVGPLTSAVTDANGTYSISYLPAGQYRVQVVATTGQSFTNPPSGTMNVALAVEEAKGGIDFGLDSQGSGWQNPRNRFDVNDDGIVTPNDALRIINKLNNEGAGELGQFDGSPPYVDVNGDFHVTSNDVLQVINEINRNTGSGEGEGAGQNYFAGGASSDGEGEGNVQLVLGPLWGPFEQDDRAGSVEQASGNQTDANEVGPLVVAEDRSEDSFVSGNRRCDVLRGSFAQASHRASAQDLFDPESDLLDEELLTLLSSRVRDH